MLYIKYYNLKDFKSYLASAQLICKNEIFSKKIVFGIFTE